MSDIPRRLDPGEAADLLAAAGEAVRGEVIALPPELSAWHPAPGEWCVKEVLGHLIEAERRGFAGRIRTIVAESEPTLQEWDPDAVARDRRDCERAAPDVLAEFLDSRRASVALVRNLGLADLTRGGHHPTVGYLRVEDLLHEWIHHDRNHIRQMFANVQAAVWPHLGNAQRFSGE
jgi:hypothetical protein